MEEWDDAGKFRKQISSDRFVHLLVVLEMSTARPVVKFRVISHTRASFTQVWPVTSATT